jgi:hypothetical protein
MKFYMATFASVVSILSACQKQESVSPISAQGGAATIGNINKKIPDGQAAAHVQWAIISLDFPITTFSPGGVAYAQAISGSTLSNLKIKFTGSGSFVDPASSGGTSSAVTGGGTWETFSGDISTGRGTYEVTKLASWTFANWQLGTFIDLTGNTNERANGTAVLVIEYSDGSEGTLGLGCHGPGAPDGIQEGVIATKGFVTYWTGEVPLPDIDKNRTIFHVRR